MQGLKGKFSVMLIKVKLVRTNVHQKASGKTQIEKKRKLAFAEKSVGKVLTYQRPGLGDRPYKYPR